MDHRRRSPRLHHRVFQQGIPFRLSYRPCLRLRLHAHQRVHDAVPNPARRSLDQRTRWPCVIVRHQVACPSHLGKRCRCEPRYIARVWDPQRRRNVASPSFRYPHEGVAWQQNMRAAFKRERAPVRARVGGITVIEACSQFLLAIGDGTALNKRRQALQEEHIQIDRRNPQRAYSAQARAASA